MSDSDVLANGYLATHALGDLFEQSHEKGQAGLPIVSLTMDRGLLPRDEVDRRVETNLTPERHRLIRKGDLAYNMMRMWQGVCHMATFDCLTSPAYVVLHPRSGLDSQFAEYLLRHETTVADFRRLSFGVVDDRLRLYYDDFCRVKVTIPSSKAVQRTISTILKTLDKLIDKTESLIAKFQAVKQGMMYDLFTRGVVGHGRLRPTQVEAPDLYKLSDLGWIPKEWQITQLCNVVESVIDGPFGSNLKTEHYVETPGVRVVRLQNIGIGAYNDEDRAFIANSHAESLSRHHVVPGDVLVAALGEDVHPVGRACLYPDPLPSAINKADCFRVRCVPTVCTNAFLMHALNEWHSRCEIAVRTQGMTRSRINVQNFKGIRMCYPPLEEQMSIVCRLDNQERLTAIEMRKLAKLKALKTGLMQDLLTGRVRVKVDESQEVASHV